MIKGQNIHSLASKVLKQDKIIFYKWSSRIKNDIGYWIDTYEEPIEIIVTLQALTRTQISQIGLDMTRRCYRIWTSEDVMDLYRDRSNDHVEINGIRYKLSNEEDWTYKSGWNSALATEVFDKEMTG